MSELKEHEKRLGALDDKPVWGVESRGNESVFTWCYGTEWRRYTKSQAEDVAYRSNNFDKALCPGERETLLRDPVFRVAIYPAHLEVWRRIERDEFQRLVRRLREDRNEILGDGEGDGVL